MHSLTSQPRSDALCFRDLKGTLLLVLLGTLVPRVLQDGLAMEVQDHRGHQDLLGHQVLRPAQVTINAFLIMTAKSELLQTF